MGLQVRGALRPVPAAFIVVQLLVLALAWTLLRHHTPHCRPAEKVFQLLQQARWTGAAGEQKAGLGAAVADHSDGIPSANEGAGQPMQQPVQPVLGRVTTNITEWMGASTFDAADSSSTGGTPAAGKPPPAPAGPPKVTTNLTEWAAVPDRLVFQDSQSRCLLHPRGKVELPQGWNHSGHLPFLFDVSSMPTSEKACKHCPAHEKPLLCCGICIFEHRRCDEFYPGEHRSSKVAQLLLDGGYQLRDFTPCELFARIRGRTLWFMGDSQTWHFYYSAECFLRNFAPSMRRTPPVPWAENKKLITVTYPVKVPPICLELALGTRVCAVRVDSAAKLSSVVLPTLNKLVPGFSKDIMIFNTGLHYATPGADGKPLFASKMVSELTAFVAWRQQYKSQLPKLIWMDVPVQHFSAYDGSYHGGEVPFACRPLAAWADKNPTVLAGGKRNMAVADLVPKFADAHLRTWNASVPLWDTHKPGECTHWCSPSAYHLWLFLLNDVLRDSRLGSSTEVAEPQAANSNTSQPASLVR